MPNQNMDKQYKSFSEVRKESGLYSAFNYKINQFKEVWESEKIKLKKSSIEEISLIMNSPNTNINPPVEFAQNTKIVLEKLSQLK